MVAVQQGGDIAADLNTKPKHSTPFATQKSFSKRKRLSKKQQNKTQPAAGTPEAGQRKKSTGDVQRVHKQRQARPKQTQHSTHQRQQQQAAAASTDILEDYGE